MTAKEEYVHLMNHAFEIQYVEPGLKTTKATIFQIIKRLDFQTKNSPVDLGCHGAAVLELNFPKSQATRGLLSLF